KQAPKVDVAKADPADTLPDKLNFQPRGEMIVVRRSWFMEGGVDMAAKQVRAPDKNLALFKAWKGAGALPWAPDDEREQVAKTAVINGPIPQTGEFFRVHLGVSMFAAFGPPPGKEIWWRRDGDSMALVLGTKGLEGKGDDVYGAIGSAMRDAIEKALETAVGMTMLPGRKGQLLAFDMSVDTSRKGQVT